MLKAVVFRVGLLALQLEFRKKIWCKGKDECLKQSSPDRKSKISKLTVVQHHFPLSKMVRMIFCAFFYGCGRRVVADSAVDAVARGRIGKYHQSRDWISRSANRHSGINFGCTQCWQRRFFCRHNHFRGDDAGVVSRLHALPCLAADTRKMRSTGVRSFCDLSPDRRDVHAVHARSTPRGMGLDHTRTHLGTGALRHNYESDEGDVAPSETGAIALSGDGLVAANRNRAAGVGHSALRIVLVSCGRNRLYNGSAIFR